MRRLGLLLIFCMLVAACSGSDSGDDAASATAEGEATVDQTEPATAPEATAPMEPTEEPGEAEDEPEATVTQEGAEPTPTEPPASGPTPGAEGPEDREIAWPASETERDIGNYLAALAAGAFEEAAWPAENNGIVFAGQRSDEPIAKFLARSCEQNVCAGPYEIDAGPGYIDPRNAQAYAAARVTHVPSGETAEMRILTFEGQRIVDVLPPLVEGDGGPGLAAALFGDRSPELMVIERFDAFEIRNGDAITWVTNWHAEDATQVEGDFVATRSAVWRLGDPARNLGVDCPSLLERDGAVLAVDLCSDDQWAVTELESREPVEAQIPWEPAGEASGVWYAERGGLAVAGVRDAEGNLVELTSADGTDLLGDDYAGLLAMSIDGRRVAYVDHRDPAAYSHFWSPIVVVRDVASGEEVDRFTLDGAVTCLEFAVDWIVACEADDDTLPSGSPDQQALASIDLTTGTVTRVDTATRIFLPAISPS